MGETTCDAKKKAWDLLGLKIMEVPQRKNPIDFDLWLQEVYKFKQMVEELSGIEVTPERLQDGIQLMNRKRKAIQKIEAFRKQPNPPISGVDALLVSQVALNQDVHQFIKDAQELGEELAFRVKSGESAYNSDGKRVLIAGSPSPMGNAKIHHLVETSGMQVVADESCTGIRYSRNLVDETQTGLDGMMKAIAERYYSIDCSCFSPNTERKENVLGLVEEYDAQGVVQNVLQYCHTYNVEAKAIENSLKEVNVPSIKIETDYSQEDTGQIRTRLEAFCEMLGESR